MPSSTAVRWGSWVLRGSRPSAAVPSGGAPPGTPILEQQFGARLNLVVEAAFGGSPSTDAASWTWTDVTPDVLVESGRTVTIKPGRADQASTTQPALCTFRLRNSSGDYSKGPLFRHYPSIRTGTPIRVRAILDGLSCTRFFGYANGWTPTWDASGNYAAVDVSASGSLRRLAQGKSVVQSPLTRAISGAGPLAYWPMEDGTAATTIASAVQGVNVMTFYGLTFAADPGLPGSKALPTFGTTGSILGNCAASTDVGHWEVHWYQHYADPSADTVIMQVACTGTPYVLYEVVAVGGNNAATLNAYNTVGAKTVLANNIGFGSNFFGGWCHIRLVLDISGGTVTWLIEGFPVAASVGGFVSGTFAGTCGAVTYVTQPPSSSLSGIALGHISVWGVAPLVNQNKAETGYTGETATTRIARLAGENAIPITVIGTSATAMGPQVSDTPVNLLRTCETADLGVLYDGFGPGLTYIARDARENSTPVLVIDAAAGDLPAEFAPIDDDFLIRNSFTASRVNGSSALYEDTTGPLGTMAVGTYDSSATLNVQADTQLRDYASYQVHLGTVEGYRYPTLPLWFHAAPRLLAAWLAMSLIQQISVINVASKRSQFDTITVRAVLEGYTETIDKFRWTVATNLSPGMSWNIGVWAADTGDTNPYLLRWDTDGATTVGDTLAGAASITVATPSGPLWTITADDFPVTVNIAGIPVAVTNITGAASPQTFTVDPATVTKFVPGGSSVSLWQPNVWGM